MKAPAVVHLVSPLLDRPAPNACANKNCSNMGRYCLKFEHLRKRLSLGHRIFGSQEKCVASLGGFRMFYELLIQYWCHVLQDLWLVRIQRGKNKDDLILNAGKPLRHTAPPPLLGNVSDGCVTTCLTIIKFVYLVEGSMC